MFKHGNLLRTSLYILVSIHQRNCRPKHVKEDLISSYEFTAIFSCIVYIAQFRKNKHAIFKQDFDILSDAT